ncbi:BTAD domain-containing putative transcriptional regulator [Streptomyces noursei]|uniref:AfsR/SARP family transcriptional regulator n=1 Tax=Streptomyces noursei TaxID=1971 RepID=UPI0033FD1850
MEGLRIAALGPLRAWRGERQLDTGPAQQRAVLTSLTLRRGQVASADELVQDVWGSDAPASAHVAVRNHVSRLRTALESESAAPRALVSVAGGYALHLPDGALDVSRAERLYSRAQAARSQGELEPAVRILAEAEALWDGTPLTGVPGPYAQRQRDRLMEYRLLLVEARLTVELQLGGHARVVGELLALADEHPLREGLRALEMLALYRCGRQADALAVYTTARRHLAAELGVDPGPELVGLHQRILEADPTLAPPPGAAAGSPAPGPAAGSDRPTWVPPAQAPPDVPDFTGRQEESRRLRDALAGAARTDATAPVISVIHGMGGVGKTALAVHAAHAVREQFPDGQLYADLRGTGRERANPYEVQELFLRSMGVLAGNVPSGREARTALYRSRMAGRRLLLLLDNAADTEQVSPLLPGTAGSAALITSRTALMCLPATTRTALEPFSEPEALALLERMAGGERCRQEQGTARDLVRACGLLPLAVRVVGARLVARPRWTLTTLAERLSDRSQRLGELEAGSLAVESVFHLGYSTLDDAEARAFRLLAIPEVPDLSPAAAAAVLQCGRREAEALLDALAHHGLLEPGEPGRYRYHDLLRLFARHRTLDTDPDAARQAALSRVAGVGHPAGAGPLTAQQEVGQPFLQLPLGAAQPATHHQYVVVDPVAVQPPVQVAAHQQVLGVGEPALPEQGLRQRRDRERAEPVARADADAVECAQRGLRVGLAVREPAEPAADVRPGGERVGVVEGRGPGVRRPHGRVGVGQRQLRLPGGAQGGHRAGVDDGLVVLGGHAMAQRQPGQGHHFPGGCSRHGRTQAQQGGQGPLHGALDRVGEVQLHQPWHHGRGRGRLAQTGVNEVDLQPHGLVGVRPPDRLAGAPQCLQRIGVPVESQERAGQLTGDGGLFRRVRGQFQAALQIADGDREAGGEFEFTQPRQQGGP